MRLDPTGTSTSRTRPINGSRSSTRSGQLRRPVGERRQRTGTVRPVADPAGIAVDPGGNVYVADTGNNRIQEVLCFGHVPPRVGSVRDGGRQLQVAEGDRDRRFGERVGRRQREQPDPEVQRRPERSWRSGAAPAAATEVFRRPSDLAIDADGTVWVVDKATQPAPAVHDGGAFLSKLAGRDRPRALASSTFRWGSRSTRPAASSSPTPSTIASRSSRTRTVRTPRSRGPAPSTPSSSASFSFTANEPGATFHCKLDGGAPTRPARAPRTTRPWSRDRTPFYAYATDSLGFDGNPTRTRGRSTPRPRRRASTAKPVVADRLDDRSVLVHVERGRLHVPVRPGFNRHVPGVLVAEVVQQSGIRHPHVPREGDRPGRES